MITGRVLAAVTAEREYQVRKWGNLDDTNSVGDFILYMERELEKARDAYKNPATITDDSTTLAGIRKVATLGIAALERHGVGDMTGRN